MRHLARNFALGTCFIVVGFAAFCASNFSKESRAQADAANSWAKTFIKKSFEECSRIPTMTANRCASETIDAAVKLKGSDYGDVVAAQLAESPVFQQGRAASE